VQMLVAYGCGAMALVICWPSCAAGESQADWEDCCRICTARLEGKHLALIVTTLSRIARPSHGVSASAASALLVHKMRNILEKVRKSDYEE